MKMDFGLPHLRNHNYTIVPETPQYSKVLLLNPTPLPGGGRGPSKLQRYLLYTNLLRSLKPPQQAVQARPAFAELFSEELLSEEPETPLWGCDETKPVKHTLEKTHTHTLAHFL